MDSAGPFPDDADGNRYLLVAVDVFTRWVEVQAVPRLRSWRVADFLHQEITARWGKPLAVHMDNGSEYRGSFERLCRVSGVVHRRITAGNSKANGMAKQTIRSLKETLQWVLTA